MYRRFILPVALTAASLIGCTGHKEQTHVEEEEAIPFVTVRNGEFHIGDSVYRYIGTNFWYGAILASEGRGGDRQRLVRELDSLKSLGIDNLRILVGGDGEEGLASHISPPCRLLQGSTTTHSCADSIISSRRWANAICAPYCISTMHGNGAEASQPISNGPVPGKQSIRQQADIRHI